MIKQLLSVAAAFLLTSGTLLAQQEVSGVVMSSDGETLPGVSVVIKGTTQGTSTDMDGKYSLEVPGSESILVYSFIGFQDVEMIAGSNSTINVTMTAGVELEEVVVTALGISREKKSLGYSTQTVSGDDVSRVKDVNFMSTLSGQVAGAQIKNSGTMGGSANVIIRGYKSISGNNQPLYVVDGIPIRNDITNSSNQRTGRGGFDYGNAAMDINPEDIESIEILKGAAATALYGSRAANGVVLIVTKKGSKGKKGGIGVTIQSGFMAGQINRNTTPTYQKQYGAGYGQYYGPDTAFNGQVVNGYVEEADLDGDGNPDALATPMGEDASYGLAFDEADQLLTWESIHPELSTYLQPQPYEATDNDATTFYETSMMINNSVAVEGASDNGSYRMSLGDMRQKGVLPNSNIRRNNASVNLSYKLTDKLTASSYMSYVQTAGLGRFGTGYDSRNPNQSFRQWYNVSTDMEAQWNAYNNTGKNMTWNPYGFAAPEASRANPHYFDNYYWTRYENFSTDERNRLIGNMVLTYQLTDWLSVMGRITNDNYDEIREERIAVGSVDPAQYYKYTRTYQERNYDLIFSLNKDLTEDLNLNGDLGANLRREKWNQTEAETNGGLVVPGVYSLSNSVNPIEAPAEVDSRRAVDGYFGRASLGYKRFLYADFSARYDVSSTLPESNNAYFYPAAALSMVYSELLNIDGFDFGKIRVNYAQVGADAPTQRINPIYDLNTPISGVSLASATNTRFNPELRPERTTSFELGFENKFFQGRAGLDLTLYRSNTLDQILAARVSSSTGSYFQFINAGNIQNQGIELSLNANIVKTDNFRWDTRVNWALNRNEVIELDGDLTTYQLASVQGGITIEAEVGQPFGVIKGTNFVYAENGEPIVYDHPFGGKRYWRSASPEIIGNMLPDWTGGWTNDFTYSNFTLSALIDVQKGGDFFSLDTWYGYGTGIYDFTAGTNDKGNDVRDDVDAGGGLPIGGMNPAVDENGDYILDDDGNLTSDGTANDVYGYYGNYANSSGWATAPNALHVYDATYVKLRQLALTYTVPSSKLENSPLGGLSVSLIGRNLAILFKNSPYTDPEAGLSAGTIQGYQSGAYPAVREYGVNVTLKF